MTYEQIQSHQIAGIRGSYGIERQLWDTPRGTIEQFGVRVPRPTANNQCASEYTVHETESAARDVWGTRMPEPEPGVLWTAGTLTLTWECPERTERLGLAEDLARWAGDEAAEAHDSEVAEDGRAHGWLCCSAVREDAERNMYAFAMEMPIEQLRQRHAAELGERAVARARREGVL
jgi:hypothetical protein